MNCNKTLHLLALLIAFSFYANAQEETNVALTVHDTSESQFKNSFELFDKGLGDGAEVPEYNPEVVIENDAPQLFWSVYPNPTNSNLVLWIKNLDSLKLNVNMTYRLYDSNGTMLMDERIEGEKTNITVEFLSPAIYFLSVITRKSIKSFKIIKH